ncbi:hypothetical protein CCAX7_42980 [Capsulimonas corticalis]|uniref:Uncharacterized protein n=1 Tax=Capsulimonas corticalis TaxID=2219043 RepID=A0A402CXN1_9BACT|nr:hypothetical protein [Capsulimonas corticalis]BDI32247.1 hypothetical protein CCAX7_42980 [Capsulimonas corticalis]
MRAFRAIAASAFLLATAVPAMAKPATQPDLLLIVYASEKGDGQMALTYPAVAPKAQVSRDIAALQSSTGWAIKGLTITEDVAPVQGATQKMTSAVFTASGAVPAAGQYFPIEPIIDALRPYPQVAITYFVTPKFQFHGLRGYDGKDVSITLDQHGSTYSYRVLIHDPHYRKLNLPLYQPSEASVQSARQNNSGHAPIRFWQVALIAAVAAIAGGLVYMAMARNA